jgi:DNA-binding transcriptional ArsR family regulator
MRIREKSAIDQWHYARPELAEGYLNAFALGLTAARGLFARRRMGKTEFLCKDLLPAAVQRDYLVAYTNLWDTSTPDIAIVSALAQALEPRGFRAVMTALGKPVKKLKASARLPGGVEGSIETELSQLEADSAATMREVLRQLDRRRKPLLLVIDEAQVLAKEEHSVFAHALRAALDIRKDRIKVVFAGSSETTLRDMFARSSEPFYNWAPLEPFPLLGDEFVAFTVELTNRLARNTLTLADGKRAFEALHRTPEFFKRFIERFMLYQLEGVDVALEHTKETVFSDEQFLKQWTACSAADRAVLAMVASGDSDLHSAAGLRHLGTLIGNPATRSTASHALRRLQDANVVTRLERGRYRIEDEAYAEWIRQSTAGHLREAKTLSRGR